jgi:hypothetical protein
MPGTTHRLIDEQSVGKRRAIVRADGADREHRLSASHEQHRFAVRMPEQHGAVGDARECDSFGQVRSAECVSHSISHAASPSTGDRGANELDDWCRVDAKPDERDAERRERDAG